MPRVYAVQFDLAWEIKSANHAHIEKLFGEDPPPNDSLVVLPEMFDTGFTMNVDRMSEQSTEHASERWAAAFARRLRVYVQAASIQRPSPDEKATNNAVVFNPEGELICRYEKIFPFSGGREPERYRGGSALATFEWNGMKVCPLICYDLRFPELWRLAAVDLGAEMFTIGASWPAARQEHWSTLLEARAIENQAYVAGVNRCGRDPFLEYRGGSKIVDAQGRVIAEADEHERLLHADVDPSAARRWREKFGALRDVRRDLLGRLESDEARSTRHGAAHSPSR